VVSVAAREGLPASWLADCQLRPRTGGEDFQRGPRSIPRSLKKQYQALGVRGRARSGPLVYAGDRLVFVPGLGIDARSLRTEGADLRCLHWEPDPGGVAPD
jgi:tRNA(Ile)-lysidine synthase